MREDDNEEYPSGLDGWSDMDVVGIPFGPRARPMGEYGFGSDNGDES